jgi:prepilin-type N-terminal cleavage/methylation domain-containing protein
MNKRSGFSLIELMLCLVLVSLMAILFIKGFRTMAFGYEDSKRVSNQQLDARDFMAIISMDLKNTGLKNFVTSTSFKSVVNHPVYGVSVSDSDISSFIYKNGTPGDTLSIIQIPLNNKGGWLGRIDTISYLIRNDTLIRTLSGSSIALASAVSALQFEYGVYVSDSIVLSQSPVSTASSGATSWQASGSGTLSIEPGCLDVSLTSGQGFLKYSTPYAVEANRRYSIHLKLTASGGFPKNLDSLRFSFRRSDNTIASSEKFLPFGSDITLTVPMSSSGDFYPTLDYFAKGTGTIQFSEIEIKCVTLNSYVWTSTPTTAQKGSVRAIRVSALTYSKGSSGVQTKGGDFTLGDMTIHCSPSKYSWRVYSQTVFTPNNGTLSGN